MSFLRRLLSRSSPSQPENTSPPTNPPTNRTSTPNRYSAVTNRSRSRRRISRETLNMSQDNASHNQRNSEDNSAKDASSRNRNENAIESGVVNGLPPVPRRKKRPVNPAPWTPPRANRRASRSSHSQRAARSTSMHPSRETRSLLPNISGTALVSLQPQPAPVHSPQVHSPPQRRTSTSSLQTNSPSSHRSRPFVLSPPQDFVSLLSTNSPVTLKLLSMREVHDAFSSNDKRYRFQLTYITKRDPPFNVTIGNPNWCEQCCASKCVHTVFVLRECFHVPSQETYYQDAILPHEIALGEKKEGSSCTVCLQGFVPNEDILIWCRACGHQFHQRCQFQSMRHGMDNCALCKCHIHSHWMHGELFEGASAREDLTRTTPTASRRRSSGLRSLGGLERLSGRFLRTQSATSLESSESSDNDPESLDVQIETVDIDQLLARHHVTASPQEASNDESHMTTFADMSSIEDETEVTDDLDAAVQNVPIMEMLSSAGMTSPPSTADRRIPPQDEPLTSLPGSVDTSETELPSGTTHLNTFCQNCMSSPIEGRRWRCRICHGYSLCGTCYLRRLHDHHPFEYRDFHFPNHDNHGWKMPRRQHTRAAVVREQLREGNDRLRQLIQRARQERMISLASLGGDYDELGEGLLDFTQSLSSSTLPESTTTTTTSRLPLRSSIARPPHTEDDVSYQEAPISPTLELINPFAPRNSLVSAQVREASSHSEVDDVVAQTLLPPSPSSTLLRSVPQRSRAVAHSSSSNVENPEEEQEPVPLSALPTQTLTEESLKTLASHSPSCTICLEDYQVGDSVRTLFCFHNFHQQCIDEWFGKCGTEGPQCCICKTSQPILLRTIPGYTSSNRVGGLNLLSFEEFGRVIDNIDDGLVRQHMFPRRHLPPPVRARVFRVQPPQGQQLPRHATIGRRRRRMETEDIDDPTAHIRRSIALLPQELRAELTALLSDNGVL